MLGHHNYWKWMINMACELYLSSKLLWMKFANLNRLRLYSVKEENSISVKAQIIKCHFGLKTVPIFGKATYHLFTTFWILSLSSYQNWVVWRRSVASVYKLIVKALFFFLFVRKFINSFSLYLSFYGPRINLSFTPSSLQLIGRFVEQKLLL